MTAQEGGRVPEAIEDKLRDLLRAGHLTGWYRHLALNPETGEPTTHWTVIPASGVSQTYDQRGVERYVGMNT